MCNALRSWTSGRIRFLPWRAPAIASWRFSGARPPGSIAMGGQPPFENLAGLQLFESHRSWTSLSSRNRFNLASDCTFASTTPSLEPTPRECLGARTGVGRSHESRVLMWVIHFCHLFVDALVLFLTLRKCKSRSQRIDCALQCRLHRGVSLALT